MGGVGKHHEQTLRNKRETETMRTSKELRKTSKQGGGLPCVLREDGD